MNYQVDEGVGLRFDIRIILQLIILFLNNFLHFFLLGVVLCRCCLASSTSHSASLTTILFRPSTTSLSTILLTTIQVSKVLHISHLDRFLAFLLLFFLNVKECLTVEPQFQIPIKINVVLIVVLFV